ncbi:hypothetical protein ACSBR2_007980 [Camellia fascicularis]
MKGTLNVLNSCSEANVKRVVVVSSGAVVSLNPEWPKGQVKDETCWSDVEYCRRTNVVLISATLPNEILEMTSKFMTDPVRILVNRDELTLEGIKQFFVAVEKGGVEI